ncbi:MAG: cyclase family protein [Bacteroidota bacterium]|nr:cyclase family protein [Bacteroidota bacterium]
MKKIYDISLPVTNQMWSYRPEWKNSISVFESTSNGGQSTVYEMKLFSHTGSYIETSQHKLVNDLILNTLPIESFYRKVKVVITDEKKRITKKKVLEIATRENLLPEAGDAFIIANGYGINHTNDTYLSESPYFEEELTNWLINSKIGLLGVDTPIIENTEEPYKPVIKLFEANPEMLLLAPLLIDAAIIKSGNYTLSCLPLNIEDTSGMLCRPVLISE